MTLLDYPRDALSDPAVADRRRAAAGPHLSWASSQPFVARPPLRVVARRDADHWRDRSRGFVRASLAADGIAGAAAAAVALAAISTVSPLHLVWSGSVMTVFLAMLWAARGYDRRIIGDGPGEFQAILRAGAVSVAGIAVAAMLLELSVPRALLLVQVPVTMLGAAIGRHVLRRSLHRLRSRGEAMSRTLVVGDGASVERVVRDLRAAPHHGYKVVGVCLPSVADPAPPIGVRTLGALADIPQVAHDHGADVVIVAGGELAGEPLRRLSWALGRVGAQLVVAPGLVEVLGPRVALRPTAGLSLLEVETACPRGRLVAKSILDRVLGTALLLAASPVIGLAAVVVRATSPGPVFFRQRRIGVDGQAFTMWKLRSMYVDAEARRSGLLGHSDRDGLMFKMVRDPRITPVGRVLRRFSIDELPQLLNVVKGDMSLVGPRPPLPEEVDGYRDRVMRRLHVRPGLTGLWQVSGRASLSWDESIQLDLRYVDNWSIAMDLLILWKTTRAVFGGAGAY
ncbi:sugar transferase [Cellulomonas fimi]|uniref:Sugar transferase n=1 Tax=Cellulomonas fimi TaxID=1708 RepID=A0A7Y0M0D3_CELFI|nr:sugar transferase [Cellulomonas fimi]NMR21430.1 sugar transferase [Cellulomonas fimi]